MVSPVVREEILQQSAREFDELLRLAAAWGRFAHTYYEKRGTGGLLVHYDADLLKAALQLQRACSLPVNPVISESPNA